MALDGRRQYLRDMAKNRGLGFSNPMEYKDANADIAKNTPFPPYKNHRGMGSGMSSIFHHVKHHEGKQAADKFAEAYVCNGKYPYNR